MIYRLKNRLNRFAKQEIGSINTIEFAVMFPILCMTLLFGVELTTHANRQFQLDRGLEVTTRAVRLHTGQPLSHGMLIDAICDNSGGLADCQENLRLEMMPTTARTFSGLSASPDCTNAPISVTPVRGFTLGEQHELVLLRACYQFTPVVSAIGLGRLFADSPNGKGTMIAMSAFVQEPE